VNVKWAFPPN